jgi:hypothetical protein
VTRCDMPPGPEAVQCEAWAAAQEVVSGLPFMLFMLSFVWLTAGLGYALFRAVVRYS